MRVLVCGSRHWKSEGQYGVLFNTIAHLGKIDVLITGDAKGLDEMVREQLGPALNIPVLTFYAEWAIYDRAAGPIRNGRMLKEGRPARVIAFHDEIAKSKGTKNMIMQARAVNVPVQLVSSRKYYCEHDWYEDIDEYGSKMRICKKCGDGEILDV